VHDHSLQVEAADREIGGEFDMPKRQWDPKTSRSSTKEEMRFVLDWEWLRDSE